MAPVQTDVRLILNRLHAEVRCSLEDPNAPRDRGLGKNRKGHWQRGFDVTADIAVRCFLEEAFERGVICSEEADDYCFGPPDPLFRFIVDPVDGFGSLLAGLGV